MTFRLSKHQLKREWTEYPMTFFNKKSHEESYCWQVTVLQPNTVLCKLNYIFFSLHCLHFPATKLLSLISQSQTTAFHASFQRRLFCTNCLQYFTKRAVFVLVNYKYIFINGELPFWQYFPFSHTFKNITLHLPASRLMTISLRNLCLPTNF